MKEWLNEGVSLWCSCVYPDSHSSAVDTTHGTALSLALWLRYSGWSLPKASECLLLNSCTQPAPMEQHLYRFVIWILFPLWYLGLNSGLHKLCYWAMHTVYNCSLKWIHISTLGTCLGTVVGSVDAYRAHRLVKSDEQDIFVCGYVCVNVCVCRHMPLYGWEDQKVLLWLFDLRQGFSENLEVG